MWERAHFIHCCEEGKKGHTRVVCNTLPNRGKSLTPESRIDILDDRSAFVDRKDEIQEANGFAITLFIHPPRVVPLRQWMDDVVFTILGCWLLVI